MSESMLLLARNNRGLWVYAKQIGAANMPDMDRFQVPSPRFRQSAWWKDLEAALTKPASGA